MSNQRRSKRKLAEAKCQESESDAQEWNAQMVTKLLALVQNQGFDGNFRELQSQFNNSRSESGFRYFFEYLQKNDDPASSSFDQERHQVSQLCDPWIEALRKNNENQRLAVDIPLMMKLIARFERHPSPDDCGRVDYPEIYNCIAALMQGHIPKQMNAASAAKLKQITDQMADYVRQVGSTRDEHEKSFLASVALPQTGNKPKNRPLILANRRKQVWSPDELQNRARILSPDFKQMKDCYLQQEGLNPLNFPS